MDRDGRIMKVLNVLLPVFLALLFGAVFIAIAGENPLTTYATLVQRSLFDFRGLMQTLHFAAPLILTGLAIGISFKAGLFNLGVEACLLMSGLFVAVLGFRLGHLPSPVLIPLLLGAGILVGILTIIIPALLKAFFNVSELVVTLLMNYAVILLVMYLATYVFRDPSRGYISTHVISSNAIFSRLFGTRLTLFFFVALAVFVLAFVIYKYMRLGYEMNALGKNLQFSEAVGINVRWKIVTIMSISGALGGLAGAGWMMSHAYAYTPWFSTNPGLGWEGLLISLLGSESPLGILIAAIFYGALKYGGYTIARYTSVPSEIIGVIQAFLILFLSIQFIRRHRLLDRFKGWFKTDKSHTEEGA